MNNKIRDSHKTQDFYGQPQTVIKNKTFKQQDKTTKIQRFDNNSYEIKMVGFVLICVQNLFNH